MGGYSISRERMVREQILSRGISCPRVIAAMSKVPRHYFVEEVLWGQAYGDSPLIIGSGQTISQPYIVALMSELLDVKEGMTVLEIGTGCGYQSAVLLEMGLRVFTVERLRDLYNAASKRLAAMGYSRVRIKLADGTLGWPEEAPFDRIIVTAGGPSIPEPLLEQLADPGIMVLPVGLNRRSQELVLVRKQDGKISQEPVGQVTFVELVGSHGW